MPIYYPGWVMRVYYDLDDKDPIKQVMNILIFVIKIFWKIYIATAISNKIH